MPRKPTAPRRRRAVRWRNLPGFRDHRVKVPARSQGRSHPRILCTAVDLLSAWDLGTLFQGKREAKREEGHTALCGRKHLGDCCAQVPRSRITSRTIKHIAAQAIQGVGPCWDLAGTLVPWSRPPISTPPERQRPGRPWSYVPLPVQLTASRGGSSQSRGGRPWLSL